MLDLKIPFSIRDSAVVPYSPKLVLADLPGLTAVLEFPEASETEEWVAHVEQSDATGIGGFELEERMRPAIERELRSMEEVSDDFGKYADFQAKMADLEEDLGNWQTAVEMSRALLGQDPNPRTAYRLARLLVEEGDLQGAKDILEDNFESLEYMGVLRLAQVHALLGDFLAAESTVDAAISLDPNDYRALMFKGSLALARRSWPEALQFFRAAAEEPNNSSTLHVNMAAALLRLRQVDKAVRELRTASKINPLDETAVTLLAEITTNIGKPELGLDAIRRHYAAGGRSAAFLERAARSLFELGDLQETEPAHYVEAKQYLSILLKNAPDNSALLWNNLGVLEERLGNSSRAIKQFSHAVEVAYEAKSDYTLPLSNVFVWHIERRNYRDVEKATRDLFEDHQFFDYSHWSKIALQRSVSLEGLGKRAASAEFLESMLENHTIVGVPLLEMLSTVLIHFTEVEVDSEKVAKYLPILAAEYDSEAYLLTDDQIIRISNNLAFASLQAGDTEFARRILGRVSDRIESNPYLSATRGLERLRSGKVDVAQDHYKHAISIAPNKKLKDRIKQRMWLELGQYFLSHGEEERGLAYLQDTKKLKFGFSHVQNKVTRLLTKKPD